MRTSRAPRVLALLAATALLGTTVPAAHAAEPTNATSPEPGTPALVDGLAEPVDAGVAPDRAAKAHLAGHKDRYRIADPAGTLTTAGVATDGVRETVRLDQKYRGLPVLGAQYVVRMEKKAGKRTVTGTSGTYYTDLAVDTTATVLPAGVAVERAVERVAASLQPGGVAFAPRDGLTGSDGGLVVVPVGAGVLTRHVTVRGVDPATGLPVLRDVYVDAASGAAVVDLTRIKTVAPVGQPATPVAAGAPGAAAPSGTGTSVHGQGVKLDGSTVPVELQRDDATGAHLMVDLTHTAPDGSTVPLTTWDATAQDYTSTAGLWPEDMVPFSSPSATLGSDLTELGAVDAAWAAGKVFEYWKTAHGRSSLDDAGSPIDSLVGITYYGQPWVNAFWDGSKMVYGTGDAEYRSMAADLDVVGHEMTHGVVEHTANLVFGGQPGAVNEAIADYFGNAIDVDAAGTAMSDPKASLLGEDLCRTLAPADCALRDLDDGMTTADFKHLPDLPVALFDSGGVHVNSTIVSGALWDLRQALGGKVADAIVYRTLTDYLTPTSDFVDTREAVVAAARSLGLRGKDLRVVTTAFESRGITEKWRDSLHGKGTDLLVDRTGTGWYTEERAAADAGWFAVPRTALGQDAPRSIWVGRTDGKAAARQISPDDGRTNVYVSVDAGRVVWLSVGDDFRILSAPVTGGPVTELYRTSERIYGLNADGGIVAWGETDPTTWQSTVRWTDDDARTVHALSHEWEGDAGYPAVEDGKIAYVRSEYLDRAPGFASGVEIYDTATGSTVVAGLDEGSSGTGYPALSSTGVAWLADLDPGYTMAGAFHNSVRTYDSVTGTSRLLFADEAAPDAIWVESLALSDTTLTLSTYAPIEEWWAATEPTDAVLTKLQQYTIDGRYLGPGACSGGTQLFPTALEGRSVLYLDSGASGVGLALSKGVKVCR